ncbi:hypothetical protein C8R43DRAFT_963034 [Mycena crocata]|nr:hypothetical protein C8R43DRAFT_963034 [Mycena crocata]
MSSPIHEMPSRKKIVLSALFIRQSHEVRASPAILRRNKRPWLKGTDSWRATAISSSQTSIMTRYTIKQGDITIAYGSDDILGVFFDVTDSRLNWKEHASEEINEVASSAATGSSGDGGGSYLALTTGMGIGKRVTRATIVEFMKRYGVPANHLDAVARGKAF